LTSYSFGIQKIISKEGAKTKQMTLGYFLCDLTHSQNYGSYLFSGGRPQRAATAATWTSSRQHV